MAKTVTLTSAGRGVRRVHAGGRVFTVGEPVDNVAEKTIQTLEAMPWVALDVAGEPDVEPPEPDQE